MDETKNMDKMDEPEVEVDHTNIDEMEDVQQQQQQETIEIEANQDNVDEVLVHSEDNNITTNNTNTNVKATSSGGVDMEYEENKTKEKVDDTITTKTATIINFGQEPSAGSIYPKEEAFFSTCPLNIIDEVYNKVDDYLNDAFDDIERRLVLSAATISIEKLQEIVQEKAGASSNNNDNNNLGGLKNTLPSSIPTLLTKHFKLNVDNIKSISFERALSVIKVLGLSNIITIDDLAQEDITRCQDIREKLDHVLDKVNFIYDKNFDKFEMYSLRNIFRIPDDLGDKTKVDIDIENSSSSSSDDKTYSEADEKNIDNKRYQLLQEIVSLRRENKRFARK